MEDILLRNLLKVSHWLLRLRIFVFLQETEHKIGVVDVVESVLHLFLPTIYLDVKTDVIDYCEACVSDDQTDKPVEDGLPLGAFADDQVLVPLLALVRLIMEMTIVPGPELG